MFMQESVRRSTQRSGLAMTLSARHSSFIKYVLPFLVVAGAYAWVYWSDIRDGAPKSFWVYLVVLVGTTAIMIFFFRRGPWSMPDSVEYADNKLRLKRWRTTESIPLADVKDIRWADRVVTIELRRASKLGTQFHFYAPSVQKVPSIVGQLESLALKVRSNRNAVET